MNVGSFFSFGHGHHSQLGSGSRESSSTPVLRDSLVGFVIEEVACGFRHTLFRTSTGQVFATGSNSFGQLGLGFKSDTSPDNRPAHVSLLTENVVRVAVGANHSVCLTQLGAVYTFGHDGHNQLGRDGSCLRPRRVHENIDGVRIVDVAAGNDHTVAVADDGRVFSWGRGGENQLGYGDGFDHCTPRLIDSLFRTTQKIVRIACGQLFCVCEDENGALWSWGANSEGQLGRGQRHGTVEPRLIRALRDKRIAEFFCGWKHAGAITAEGDLWIWGNNKFGQLGLNPFPASATGRNITVAAAAADDVRLSASTSSALLSPPKISVSRRASDPSLTTDAAAESDHSPGGSQQSNSHRSSSPMPERRSTSGSTASTTPQYYPRLVRGVLSGQNVVAGCGGWKHTVVRTDSYGSLGLGHRQGERAVRARYGCFQLVLQGSNVGSIAAGGEHTVIVSESIRTLPLARDLRQLQASGVGADVCFTLANGHGTKFLAHQCVLAARCPAMLQTVLKAKRNGRGPGTQPSPSLATKTLVRLRHGTPALFELLLLFIYGDDCGLSRPSAGDDASRALIHGLISLARRFALHRLVALCERLLQPIESLVSSQDDSDDDNSGNEDGRKDKNQVLMESTLTRDIGSLQGSPEYADVVLQVERKDFGETQEGNLTHAHLALLACRAPTAAAQLGLRVAVDIEDDEEADSGPFPSYDDDDHDHSSGNGSSKKSLSPEAVALLLQSSGAGTTSTNDDDETGQVMEAVFVEDMQISEFRRLMSWIYKDNRDAVSREQALSLLAASDKYGLTVLKSLCLNTIMLGCFDGVDPAATTNDTDAADAEGWWDQALVTADNVVSMLAVGKKCQAPRLVTYCLDLLVASRDLEGFSGKLAPGSLTDSAPPPLPTVDDLTEDDVRLLRQRLAQEQVPCDDDDELVDDGPSLLERATGVADTITSVIGTLGGTIGSKFKRRSKSPSK